MTGYSRLNFKPSFTLISLLAVLPAFFLLVNKYPLLNISAYMLLLAISFMAFTQKGLVNIYHYKFLIILIIIFIYFIMSYFASNQPIGSIFSYEFLRWDGAIIFSYIAFFIFAVPFLNYKKTLGLYFIILFIVFSLFSVMGLIEYFTNNYVATIRIDDIYVGPMFVALNNSHNATGSAYSVVSVFALSYLLTSEKRFKVFYFIVLLFCFIGLFITKSRGSLLGFAAGAIVVIFLHVRSIKKFLVIALVLILLVVPIIYFTGTFGRIAAMFSAKDLSSQTRLIMWDRAWDLFLASPIVGIGFGRYNDVYWLGDIPALEEYNGLLSLFVGEEQIFNAGNAHNSYLHLLAENGIIGLIIVLFFWIYCFYFLFKKFSGSMDEFNRPMYLSSLGGVAALFGLSLTEHYMASPTVMVCLSIAVSLAIGMAWEEDLNAGR